MVTRLQSFEGVTRAGGYASKVAYLYDCWQEALCPCHVDLSLGLFVNIQVVATDLFRMSDSRESKEEATMPFMT